MNYIDENLMAGEHVIYRAKLHWIVFLWTIIWFVLALILFMGGKYFAIGGGVVILISIIAGVLAYISYSSSEFGVTNKRVLVKVGFIRRHSLETLLTKVSAIQVDQGVFGRILGYGTIIVTGTVSTEHFHKISAPLEFRKKIQEQVASVQSL